MGGWGVPQSGSFSSCSLDSKVHHVGSDFMKISLHLQKAGYDAIVSWLTVLHFENRVQLFKQCYEVGLDGDGIVLGVTQSPQQLLRPGGVFYAADFVANGPLTARELRVSVE